MQYSGQSIEGGVIEPQRGDTYDSKTKEMYNEIDLGKCFVKYHQVFQEYNSYLIDKNYI